MSAPDRLGVILVLCAPSGTGKSTLTRRLLAEFPRLRFSVSCTTRPPRPGEAQGREYLFMDEERFLRLRTEGYFAETAQVHGNHYGTPRQATLDMLAAGQDVIFDIDVQGARRLKETFRQGRYVFLLPPSRQALEERLRARDSDSPEAVARRLAAAPREMAEAGLFDTWIVNDDLERAYDDLRAAYLCETLSPRYRPGFLDHLLADWTP